MAEKVTKKYVEEMKRVADLIAGSKASRLPEIFNANTESDFLSDKSRKFLDDFNKEGGYAAYLFKQGLRPPMITYFNDTPVTAKADKYPPLYEGQAEDINPMYHEFGHGVQYQSKKTQADRDTLLALINVMRGGKRSENYTESEADLISQNVANIFNKKYSKAQLNAIANGETIPKGSILLRKEKMPKNKMRERFVDEIGKRAERMMVNYLRNPLEYADESIADVEARQGQEYKNPNTDAYNYYMSTMNTAPGIPADRGFVEYMAKVQELKKKIDDYKNPTVAGNGGQSTYVNLYGKK